jgi:hypothetical protein
MHPSYGTEASSYREVFFTGAQKLTTLGIRPKKLCKSTV